MFIRSDLAYVIDIPVPCGHCGEETGERAADLVTLHEIVCRHCGALLDLDSAEWATFRNTVKEFSVGKQSPIAPVKKRP